MVSLCGLDFDTGQKGNDFRKQVLQTKHTNASSLPQTFFITKLAHISKAAIAQSV
jgi:hypothetical protein